MLASGQAHGSIEETGSGLSPGARVFPGLPTEDWSIRLASPIDQSSRGSAQQVANAWPPAGDDVVDVDMVVVAQP